MQLAPPLQIAAGVRGRAAAWRHVAGLGFPGFEVKNDPGNLAAVGDQAGTRASWSGEGRLVLRLGLPGIFI